jgi:hypothetical protein
LAKTNFQDPGSSEIRSTHISGVMEAINKIEESLNMDTVAETDVVLPELFISEDDRYRIFQAPEGKRNWLNSPAPVIKKNGVVISTGFGIDYGGGAIVFNPPLTASDTVTASFTRTKNTSGFNAHLAEMTSQIITVTRDLSLTGAQIISGFSRVPKHIIIQANQHNNPAFSIGHVTKTSQQCITHFGNGNTAGLARGVTLGASADNYALGQITINDDQTITINWTNVGTGATGTAYLRIIPLYHGED